MAKSITTAAAGKAKPHPDFPLFKHATGRWCKKVKGRFHYFGKIADDPKGEAAIALWNEQKDDLLAGRTPRPKVAGFLLRELLDRYMVSKRHLLDTREITPKHFAELYATSRRIGDSFGLYRPVVDLGPDDFERLRKAVAKQWGPVRLGNEIQRVRSVFKFALESGLIDKPTLFGPGFRKPSRKVLRKNRAANGLRMFEAAEVRAILDAANPPMKAMILLGLNAGFGNADVATLPMRALDLVGAWVTYPRPKTGVERRCSLWPETVAAIHEATAQRTKPKREEDAALVFITKHGHPWATTGVSEPDIDTGKITVSGNVPVTHEFTKLLKRPRCPACGKLQAKAKPEHCEGCEWKPTHGKSWGKLHRKGLGFYTLRHVFRTVADATRDFPAVRFIMGHVDESMDGVYRETIGDDRLQAVANHVHAWLFGTEATK
jgi:hypothetical protein